MKTIKLSLGYEALVDDDVFKCLNFRLFKWSALKSKNGRIYAFTRVKNKTIYLHRLIARPQADQDVDHIDGNQLNNQRSNLRCVTRSRNNMNSRGRKNLHGFPGVTASNYRWYAANITLNKTRIYLGSYNTKEKAAEAYRKAYLAALGEEHPFYRT